jgi:hypothetical protein
MTIPLPTEEGERELWRLYRFYGNEAQRCENAKAYLAGCLMLGSVLETLLILMISAHSEEIETINAYPSHKKAPKPLLTWTLAELLAAAKKAAWLPSRLTIDGREKSKQFQIGDYAEIAREVRNLIHPARYQKDHNKKRVTSKMLQRQYDIVLACRDWLLKHNNEALAKTIDEAGRKAQQSGNEIN